MLNLFRHGDLASSRALGPGLTATVQTESAVHAKFDWTLYVSEAAGELRIGWVYNADLFSAERMAETARQFERLLRAAVESPDAPVASCPLVTAESSAVLPDPREALSAAWRGAVHEVFARRAAEAPERLAAADPSGSLSYGELERASNRLAHALAAAGVRRGDRVAVWAHRSAPMAVALVGAMKAGGVFVVLDPAYPAARLAAMVSRARPSALVEIAAAGEPPAELAAALGGAPRLRLGDAASLGGKALLAGSPASAGAGDALAGFPETPPSVAVGPDDPAYIAFTSGSTGEPKGIVGRHGSLSHFIPWQVEAFGFGAEDRFTCLSGLAHDPLHRDLFTPLQVGASAVFPEPERIGEPGYLASWARRERVTVAHLTPAMGQLLSQPAEEASAEGRALGSGSTVASLAWVFLVGDVLTRRDVDRLEALAPSVTVVNYYGSTETQRAVGWHRCTGTGPGAAAGEREVLPLGRGIPDVQLLVLTPAGGLAGIGELGEIAVRSPHLALGYLDDPEQTAARFVVNPWRPDDPSDRCYRTGDLGRYRPDGEVEFAGRADHQVKIRGFRIELGEIEAALGRHPAVREAAVIAREDGGRERYLAAYVVAAPGAPAPAAAELRAHLAARLPDYMVPAAFVPLDALPLTPNRKLDRRALPAPEPAVAAGSIAPRTPAESAVAALFGEVLGRSEVGAGDRFFDLGGHSLLAIRLLARLRRDFGVELPVRRLFEASSVAEVAAEVERLAAAGGTAAESPPPIRPVPGRPEEGPEGAPPSFAQERLWFLEQYEPGTSLLLIPTVLSLSGALDPAALGAALTALVARQAALRTSFATADGRPLQRVAPPAPVALPLIDLGALPDAAGRRAAERLLAGEARRPLDVERGPLYRARLVRLAPGRHRLSWVMHHLVSDGWSVGVWLEELAALYRAAVDGTAPALAPLPVSYADFAAWQRDPRCAARFERELEWWRERLAGAPDGIELPVDRPRPRRQTFRAGNLRQTLPPELTAAVKELAAGAGATPYMVFLAALSALLRRLTGESDVLIGSPIAGRNRPEIERLIGIFLNTLVLRVDAGGAEPTPGPSFRELLGRAREAAVGAFAHQEVPFERLLAALEPRRDPSRTPWFSVFLNLLGHRDAATDRRLAPGLTASLAPAPAVHAKFDWTLYVSDGADGLRISWVYNADLFSAERMAETARQLERLLRAAVESPDAPVVSCPLVTAESSAVLPDPRQPLSSAWRGAVHEVFARRAAEAPERLAAADPSGSLSYGELERAANRLAHALAAAGVGRGDRVAVWAHRSAPLAVALVGAMKAGGVFVVLDPAYPEARLAAMVSRARPSALVEIAAAGEPPAELAAALGGAARLRLGDAASLGGQAALGGSPASAGAGDALSGFPETPPPVAVGPDDPAYIAFTSGSTGEPKGIVGRHGSLSHFIPWQVEAFGFGAEDRFTCLSGLAHDPLHRDLFTPLQVGASAVFPEPERIGEPGYLASWARRERVTVAHLTPAMGQLLSQPAEEASAEGRALGPGSTVGSLAWVFLVGDVLTRRDVDRLEALAPSVTVVNYYGSTETQRAVGWHRCTGTGPGAAAGEREVLPLGRGIPDVQLLVLAPAGELAGIGELGEIAVRSPHLALGYLDDPEQTAARFVVNPWRPDDPSDRCYRTGDLGRYRPDGEVEFAGRADHQVKIRGFRIELGEIEAALGRHPAVREAVVIAREDGGREGERYLAAYVVAAPGAPAPAAAELRAHLAARLPDYMVPAAFVPLDALPLTPNRKLDRRALPAPERSPAGGRDAAPRSPAEEAAVEAFRDVLGLPEVGVHDHFFECGGHSLLATRVVARLGRVFGVELPLAALFGAPTPAGLAAAVEAAASHGPALPPIEPVLRAGADLPLSFSQERLWFLDRLEPASPAYNLALALRLSGAPAAGAPLAARLRGALAAVVRRHEALRTRFAEVDGVPVQRVEPPWAPALPEVDLSALAGARREAEAGRLRHREAGRGFRPAARPAAARPAPAPGAGRAPAPPHPPSHRRRRLVARGPGRRAARAGGRRPGRGGRGAAGAADPVRRLRGLAAAVAGRRGARTPARLVAGARSPGCRRWRCPTDRPRPAAAAHRGRRIPFALAPEAAGALGALARREGATLFMVLLAGFEALLARAAGQDDFAVGTFVANRTRGETEGLIGFFVNNLALRADLAGEPTFRELVARVRATTLGAYAHQDVPFERVLEAVRPPRDLSRAPLFQVMLVLQNLPRQRAPAGAAAGPPWEALPKGSDRAHFDLTLWLSERGGGLTGAFEYRTDLFDPATAERLAERFGRLLSAAAVEPGRAVAELPGLAPEEARQIAAWQSGPPASPAALGELVAASAARRPDAAAVVAGGRVLTYAGLVAAADRLAGRLRPRLAASPAGSRNPAGQPLVAVALERSPELVVALLAALKAGAAYLPLDPGQPAERLRWLLADARPALVVTRGLPAAAIPPGVAAVDPFGEPAAAMPPAVPEAAGPAPPGAADPAWLAYVIYTSGSTGQPKGVAVTQGAMAGYAADAAARFGLAPGDRVMQFAAPSFDASAEEIWATLAAGATLVLRDDACLGSPAEFFAACGRWEITVLDLPTAYWHELVAGTGAGDPLPAGLRLVILGGERARIDDLGRWWRRTGPRMRLINTYGPTEATIVTTAWEAEPAAAAAAFARGEVPIGRPVGGTRALVLDRRLRALPPGAPGELWVGETGLGKRGAGEGGGEAGLKLARGYLGRPALTAERFVPDPEAGRAGGGGAGARIYRTGDLVRWLPEGELAFLGRVDLQVKLRGFRIEPEEVEAALAALPEVAGAAVAVRESRPGDARLVAWVVPAAPPAPPGFAAGVRRALAAGLPDYLVPAAFVVVDRLPRTPAGKLDRRTLPDPDWAGTAAGGERVAPRDAVEEALAAIWGEVLGVAEVGVHDDFFALGGHSLLATQVVSRVRRLFAAELPLAALFAAPTLAGVGERVRALLAAGAADAGGAALGRRPRPLPDAAGRVVGLPLSFAQERLYFLDRLQPGSAAYNLPALFRLAGPLDPAALGAALGAIARRHETLRSRFVPPPAAAGAAAVAVAAIDPPAPVPLPVVDLAALPGAGAAAAVADPAAASPRGREVRRLAAAWARRPFDLARGPLLSALLLRLAPEDHLLAAALHHAVADGWSLVVLKREIGALYESARTGRPSPLPALPIQYVDWAAWQREWLAGDRVARELGWWRERLAGAPPVLELPADRPRPPVRRGRGGTVRRVLGGEHSRAWADELAAAARAAGVTPFMVLLAGFAAVLGRWSGQRDLVIGTPVAGRTRVETEGLIGLFVNSLALRLDLAGTAPDGPPFATILERVRTAALGAFAHQDLPFERVVAELAPRRDTATTPLFQVLFVLHNPPRAAAAPSSLAVELVGAEGEAAQFDLSLAVAETAAGLVARLNYDRDLFDRATAERLLGHLGEVLTAGAAEPELPLGALPLLTSGERAQLLAWNDTACEYAGPLTLPGLIAAQAEATPDAVAVAFGAEQLTYAGLLVRARSLAVRLRRLGVGPEVPAAIAVERSLELVIALTAVLEAGGAYVPLDPSYPDERLAFMLADLASHGGVPVVLVQERLAARFAGLAAAGGPGPELVAVDAPGAFAAAAGVAGAGGGRAEIDAGLDGDHAAYTIYTSGSTGRPKGAVNSHRAIRNRLLWMRERFALGPADRVLQKTPAGFDVSVWEFFGPLIVGARLVVARPGGHQDPAYLARTIAAQQITTIHFVPSMLQVFLGEPGLERLTSLSRVIASGEALPPDLVRRAARALPPAARLYNLYGPTEAAVEVTCWPADPALARPRAPIGAPIGNTAIHLLDRALRPQPVGVPGELAIGGVQVGRGYLGRPALTAERFVPDPTAGGDGAADGGAGRPGARVYLTGDLARRLADGQIEYLGRLDHQVKIRGVRIELGEIEAALAAVPGVAEAVVVARDGGVGSGGADGGGPTLVAYWVAAAGAPVVAEPAALRARLRLTLPEPMVPAAFVRLPELPLSPNGKVDRKALPPPPAESEAEGAAPAESRSVAPRAAAPAAVAVLPRQPAAAGRFGPAVAAAFAAALGRDQVPPDASFFDLGGHSLLLVRVQRELARALGIELPMVDLFRFPSVAALAAHLGGGEERAAPAPAVSAAAHAGFGEAIAIVGMAGRFPGAADVDEFWANLEAGVESIVRYSDEELAAAGVDEATLANPRYVRAGAPLAGPDLFDAGYFGYSPREAQIMDPQQRIFLECAVTALDDAAIDPGRFAGQIGVFAGAAETTYLFRLAADVELARSVGAYQAWLANKTDYLPTRVAYKLDLLGPALNVQTACSTSLVAVHLACRSLAGGECDVALAGGVSVGGTERRGYLAEEGGIASPEGRVRTFAAGASGTVRGHGIGIVVLKRLADAVADGDRVRAVIRGSAINNDGGRRAGWTAPSVARQEAVITLAQERAGVSPAEIDYIEAHGTGTRLGDPIEVAALTRAFRRGLGGRSLGGRGTAERGFCALGSVKTNIGHLDAAAGVAGLIKTVLALEHERIPPSLHFDRPNPEIDFEASPFSVAATAREWRRREGRPRRAGVSSFGIGGTNAHVVVEEAPLAAAVAAPAREWQVLPLSARTPTALAAASAALADHLERAAGGDPAAPADTSLADAALADAAWTLQDGRRRHEHRRAVVCRSRAEAVAALRGEAPRRAVAGIHRGGRPGVVFLLPGQGAQRAGMAAGLYAAEPAFRAAFDRCRELIAAAGGPDLGVLLDSAPAGADGAAASGAGLDATEFAQPALFAVEVALAALWRSWGVEPAALLGHSLGELVAACLAGVFTLEAAAELVVERGRLMAACAPGAMLAAELPEAEARALAGELAGLAGRGAEVALAAVNGPRSVTFAGPEAAIAALAAELAARGTTAKRLPVARAFHSPAMAPILPAFAAAVLRAAPRPPELPVISNLTGRLLTADEAVDPDYWARQLRSTVRFGDGIAAAVAELGEPVLLEVGPGRTLSGLARRHPAGRRALAAVASLPRPGGDEAGADLLAALGRLWTAGVEPDWAAVQGGRRRKVALPSYPFERRSFWIETPAAAERLQRASAGNLDPRSLSAPFEAGTAAAGEATAPRDAVEEGLAAVWGEVLGVAELDPHDDFFALGGHSLLATQVVSRVRGRFGVELPLADLFATPTLAGMADEVRALLAAGAAGGTALRRRPRPRPDAAGRVAGLPLTFAQERLYFLDRLQPGGAAYNVPGVWRVRGPLEPAALGAALSAVARRHETLRSRFVEAPAGTDGGAGEAAAVAVVVVDPPAPVPLPVVDLGALPSGARRAEGARLAGLWAHRPFDLARGPILIAALLRLEPEEHLLAATFHHAVSDGWSLVVFRRELAALYDAARERRPSPLAPLPIQYADWAGWQRERLSGDRVARELDWWRRRLAGAPPRLDLPADRPRPPLRAGRGGTVRRVLGGERGRAWADDVSAAARAAGATPFMALLAGFAAVLGRWSGQRDLVVGTPVAGRTQEETEGLIGLFVNTLALRLDLAAETAAGGSSDGPPFGVVLERVRETALGAFAHQDLPFERLVAELAPRRDLASTPLFQVLFVLHNQPKTAASSGLGLELVIAEGESAQFDLTLAVGETAAGFVARLTYDRDLFDRATAERLLGHLEVLTAAAEPELPLGALPLLTAAERAQLAAWNDTARAYPGPLTLPELIAAQAAATPDAVAVAFGAEQLTYAGLLARARSLAVRLRRLGVGPEVPAAVALERSLELVIALAAVLEAGGAYVPLDPSYPDERLGFMLADLGAHGRGGSPLVVLTEERLAARLAAAAGEGGAALAFVTLDGPDREPLDQGRLTPPDPDCAAYAIYTSGSTGRPKCALNTHRAIHNRLAWMQEAFALGPADRVLQKTPAGFDVSVWEFFWPLAAGARLVVALPGGHQDPAYLARTIAAEEITTIHFVPSMLQVFLGERGLERLTSLSRVIVSGEALPPELVRRAARTLPPAARLHNLYGPTEAAVDVTWWPADPEPARRAVPIGAPIANTAIHLIDRGFRPQPVGVPGELAIGGVQVGRGYLGRAALTAERFVPDPTAGGDGAGDGGAGRPGARVYLTGDLARRLPDGQIEYLGRLDHQVKIRGVRIELGEIEAALAAVPGVAEAVVVARDGGSGDGGADGAGPTLVAYWVAAAGVPAPPEPAALKARLRATLPEPMVPAAFVRLPALPLSPNGKVDRKALPAPVADGPARVAVAARAPVRAGGGRLEPIVAAAFGAALRLDDVPPDTSFFDLGGHSLLLVGVQRELARALGIELPMVDLFRFPSVATLAAHLGGGEERAAPAPAASAASAAGLGDAIAIVGMAGRFPGAADVEEFWANLEAGVESIVRYSDEELAAAGVDAATLADPRYVRAGAPLAGSDLFDAAYFGVPPREAQIMDPQQRVFLECAVTALDDAAVDPGRFRGRIGVFAGSAETSHLLRLAADHALARSVGAYQAWLANKADYLPTRVAYKLDLRGPALNVQTACSTSLVAVHLACRALAGGECDVALAGGVSVGGRDPRGYLAEEGGIESPEGSVRAFAAGASGTVRGHGVGIVVLKRLADALADGDRVRAVVRGSAINNDGGTRAGWTAPGVAGQEEVIAAALERARVSPAEIDCIEAHGTGTRLGDPIEVAALTRVFRRDTAARGFCALGSVKTNIGHLDAAAGVAGLIKTVLALEHERIPPSLHFDRPNPEIDFEASPFSVAATAREWRRRDGRPRRAGVSSFGIGGTNAHVVVEEAPPAAAVAPPAREWQVLPLSARTPSALATAAAALADHLERTAGEDPASLADASLADAALADAAWTLQDGRRRHEHRRAVVCRSRAEAVAALRGEAPRRVVAGIHRGGRPGVVFLLPGQGAQRAGMAAGLYAAEPAFRDSFDRCRELIAAAGGPDLGALLEPEPADRAAAARVDATEFAQPALFAVEVALAALWRSWGIEPAALLGHSLGELVAAYLAGVFTLEAAAELVVERGRLMAACAPGAMLAAELPEAEAEEIAATRPEIALAAVNAPEAVVFSGPEPAVAALAAELAARGTAAKRLPVARAFHSLAMAPILAAFAAAVRRAAPRPPELPVISNLTGRLLTAEEAVDPDYWARQLRSTVRFADGVAAAVAELGEPVLLEVGPGRTLSGLARRHPAGRRARAAAASLPRPGDDEAGAGLAAALGRLWTAGVEPDWAAVQGGRRRKVALPSYPFERRSFWIEAPRRGSAERAEATPAIPATAASPAPGAAAPGGGAGDALGIRLAALLADLLGVGEVGLDDDFFEIGGSSLLAVRLGARARRELGIEIAPQLLLERPTVAALAAALAPPEGERAAAEGNGNASAGPPLLVELAAGGAGVPLVLVHPAGGHAFGFRELAARLAAERPVWALRAPGLAPGEEPLAGVPALAERYLAELRARRPVAPYLLGGSSMGGMIAWEMARRLAAAGEEAPLVVMFDTFGPGELPEPPADGAGARAVALAGPGGTAAAESVAEAERLTRVMRANTAAMFAYAPEPFAGRVVFFRAAERRPGEPAHPERPWLELACGGAEFHVVPGDHESLLRPPGVDRIAARLRAALEPWAGDPAARKSYVPMSRLRGLAAPLGLDLDP